MPHEYMLMKMVDTQPGDPGEHERGRQLRPQRLRCRPDTESRGLATPRHPQADRTPDAWRR